MLDFVNKYFPDILPESVLRHYGYDARPEGKIGESAMYSDRSTAPVSNRSLLANALESVAQNDVERNKLNEYKSKITLIEFVQAKLSELRAKIKELSFAKGARDTAIQGKMGSYTYYSFPIEPEKLLKIGYVLHRSEANKNMMPTYEHTMWSEL